MSEQKLSVEVRDALEAALPFFEEMAEGVSYGYGGSSGDPRDHIPDVECCTPEEIANHKAACEAWDAAGGEPEGWTPPRGSEWVPGGHILRAPWGVGTYTWRDPAMCKVRDKLRNAITLLTPAVPEGKGEDNG